MTTRNPPLRNTVTTPSNKPSCWVFQGLIDLDACGAADLPEVARAPIVGAQRPAGLKRQRHHLLDPLAADRISEEQGAEQAVGQAGDEGGGHSPVRTALCLASTVFSVECLLAHARVNDKLDKCDNGRNESPAENQIEQAPTGSPQIKLVGTESA